MLPVILLHEMVRRLGPWPLLSKPHSSYLALMERKEVLSEGECWQLLATATVGRLALSVHALPAILPVQYYLEDGGIAACLGQFDVSEQSGHNAVVAFSVDQIDEENRSGWSVNVIGLSTFAYRVNGVLNDCGEPAAGQIVHLEPKVVTGQRLTLCPFITSHGSARLPG